MVDIATSDIVPTPAAILSGQGAPKEALSDARITELVHRALDIYRRLCNPAGVMMELPTTEFETVYLGEGNNSDSTPLEDIFPQANHLALYAITVGEPVCREIGRLFDTDEYPLGAMLDSAASAGAELASEVVLQHYREYLLSNDLLNGKDGIMPFSPGYCGWHVSGQKRLFGSLMPEQIGINLSESCLMQPLKSISGILVAGRKAIFEFDDDFSFCDECRNRSCRDRIKALYEQ